MKNIVLLGFMGTGKSAVAKSLADSLEMELVSVDALIEEREESDINGIFAGKGEAHFRKVEKEVIGEVSLKENAVIDAGGGVVLDPGNLENLRKNGVLFCLNASADTIMARTEKETHRPLLNSDDPFAKIKDMLRKRAPYYAAIEHQIDTDGKSVADVTGEVISIYNDTAD